MALLPSLEELSAQLAAHPQIITHYEFVSENPRLPERHMGKLARFLRAIAKLRFRILGLAMLKDLPTERFNQLIQELAADGWRKVGEYKGFDAWIDYGRLTMRRRGVRLKFEWDNWTEGSVEGPRKTIEKIAQEHDLRVMYEWRWSEWDEER